MSASWHVFCPEVHRISALPPAPFYWVQSSREYLLRAVCRTVGCKRGWRAMSEGHSLEFPNMRMIKSSQTLSNFSTIFKFSMKCTHLSLAPWMDLVSIAQYPCFCHGCQGTTQDPWDTAPTWGKLLLNRGGKAWLQVVPVPVPVGPGFPLESSFRSVRSAQTLILRCPHRKSCEPFG